MIEFFNILLVGILLGGIYGIVAIGLNLVFGTVRLVNFAQGELVMLGMYGAYLLYTTLGLNPYTSVLIIAPVMFIFGMALQRVVFSRLQRESTMQVFATFGLLMLLQNIALGLTGGESRSIDWPFAETVLAVGPFKLSFVRVVVLAALTVATLGMQMFLSRTMAGKAVRAVIQDRQVALTMGINVERTYCLAFGAGCALAGVAGALLAPIYSVTPWIGGNFVLAAFAVVVLGGLGSVWGAYVGGLIVGIVETFAGFYIDPAIRQAVWFGIFIVVLIIRPSGLLGLRGAEEVGFRAEH